MPEAQANQTLVSLQVVRMLNTGSRGGFTYDSEEQESPAGIMASYMANSARRLRVAVVDLIRERTRERRGKNISRFRGATILTSDV